ncbi:FadR/GntR family transcriptional regulator [Sneathiella litorea]|uniref:FCD domain-containing protein n=1 Tax=Sneathiella litorea TaxID=2606216 RepID=A0A6L8WD43_9PROT|nr:FCD domain-containing protein [Sneathiella litorea]MZR32292.1 FCD domain-containing protein [Sneathiella litorea]
MSSKILTVTKLRNLIRTSYFAPQAKLPSERDLATELQVSRSTLRAALGTLEAEGEIWRHVGRGTFVGKRPPENTEVFPLPADLTNPAEVMEVRLIIEPQIADLAAHRATVNDIDFMKQCLEKGDMAQDTADYEMWDGALHRAIAEAARNTLLLALFNAVNAIREHAVWGRLKEATLNDQRRRRYSIQHKNLVRAIERRDAVDSQRLMREHLTGVRDDMLI